MTSTDQPQPPAHAEPARTTHAPADVPGSGPAHAPGSGPAGHKTAAMDPVRLEPDRSRRAAGVAELGGLADRALACNGAVGAALTLAVSLGQELPHPMEGRTMHLWESLATLGACNLTVARTIEPHLDALSIIHQAPSVELDAVVEADDSCWGVFAAEGKDHHLKAHRHGDGWVLTGTKPWCSLATHLTHAIVTARTDSGRRAFAVSLKDPGVSSSDVGWVALGLPEVTSGPVSFDHVPATPIGGTGWYFSRPGFSWGGAGVAAIWFGAATAVARRVYAHGRGREPDQISLMHLGLIDGHLAAGRNALAVAARRADGTRRAGPDALTAARARAAVAHTSESILELAGHAMGPEPLAFDIHHARRTADLAFYLRQDHAERSVASIGQQILAQSQLPW
ncbi:acyl-CoA dehydrogenase family protein [Paenarthrobacter sp. PH39-S1]|uniref:acyl-CoA dehydrogenase family protein n=1 Tax=Paenarthrobacter sp. PH39-S1 TaxID=3046204 RepID=UPI0024BA6704|nr:acyl-CoA dehydrogenase family protein [Paenarthrobacter sp. PH39-S1]MDJ0355941.1 acyl-CoA dehydrogenase [Paenarthrobacter sp. PH39-S1]